MATREIIARGTIAGDGTGDTFRQGAAKVNNNTGKIFFLLGGDSNELSSHMSFDDSSLTYTFGANTLKIQTATLSGNRTVTIPDTSGTLVIDGETQTLTNKTLTSPVLTTPQINNPALTFQYVFAGSAISADRTVTLPLLTGNDTFTFNSHAQTLTNKTLDSATVNNPVIAGNVYDENGANLIDINAAASAVNYFTYGNSAASASPAIGVNGLDTHINLRLNSKGTGSVLMRKAAYLSTTVTANGALVPTSSYYDLNKATALALTLDDGTTEGEMRILTNRGAGTATITPSNFAQGTSFALEQNEAAQVIWDGNNWFLIGNQSVATIA